MAQWVADSAEGRRVQREVWTSKGTTWSFWTSGSSSVECLLWPGGIPVSCVLDLGKIRVCY
jgi:hypothetical protein